MNFEDKRYRSDFYSNLGDIPQQTVIQYPELDIYKQTEFSIYTKNRVGLHKNEIKKYKLLAHVQDTEFSNLFFSSQNIQIIQNELRYRVYINSNKRHIIDEQDIKYLGGIMESIYLNYSKNPSKSCDFKQEITRLNNLVLNYCVPQVISNIEMNNTFMKKITSDIYRQDNPQFTSSKGSYLSKMLNPGFN